MKLKIAAMIIIFVLLLNLDLPGYFVFNGAGVAFNTEGKRTTTFNNSGTFNDYIVEGGSKFLKSYSDLLLLMQKVEVGENDLEVMNKLIGSAIRDLEDSKTAYSNLCRLAADSPYDIAIIKRLKHFNYQSYFSSETGLNPTVFKHLTNFLKKGDVRGIYNEMLQDVSLILEKLKFLEIGINASGLPDITQLWKLNQMYSNALLFGQYTAQIFPKI